METAEQEIIINTWNDYQDRALSTALRPQFGASWTYPTFGLAGEAGELAEKIELLLAQPHLVANNDDLIKELGDVYWYTAAVSFELGLKLDDVAAQAMLAGIDRIGAHLSLARCALRICAAQGKVCELLKKGIRDADGIIDDERQDKLTDALGQLLRACGNMAATLGCSPQQVMLTNAYKLAGRKARGVIKGDGDNR